MVNIGLLQEAINESGLKESALAKKSGVKYRTIYNRLQGIGEFKASEIQGLSDALKLTKSQRENIFFGN